MLTSPKEESALAIVIPRNTCELLSLISLQLALSVCAKTGDLLSDCQALDWLFQHIFFPVCLFCDKGHTESEGNLTNRGFPPWKGCQTQQHLDAGKCLGVGRAWQGELCTPALLFTMCHNLLPYPTTTEQLRAQIFISVMHYTSFCYSSGLHLTLQAS